MKQVFMTTSSDSGYHKFKYSKDFIDSFLKFNPGLSLTYYYDKKPPKDHGSRLIAKPLRHPAITRIYKAARLLPVLKGRLSYGQYAYKFDMASFCHKVFAMEAEIKHLHQTMPGEDVRLIWLDSDVEVLQPFPENLFSKGESDLIYLSRKGNHCCTSFLSWRVSPNAVAFLENMARLFDSGLVMMLKEWNDAYLLDFLVGRKTEDIPKVHFLSNISISVSSLSANVDESVESEIFNIVFLPYMIHKKGARKYQR